MCNAESVTPILPEIDYIIPVFQITDWGAFTNQPANDGIEIVSNSVSDTGYITLFGTTYGTNLVVYEEIKLNGTSAVSTTKTNWGNLYGAYLGRVTGREYKAAVGTITIREASGDQTITTITANNYSKGMINFLLPGKGITVDNQTGNTWVRTKEYSAANTGGLLNGSMALSYNVSSGNKFPYVSMSSDSTGSTCQIWVYDY